MLRKIAELPYPAPCAGPEHNPPTMIVLSAGVYEHTCPRCGQTQRFAVAPGPTCSVESMNLFYNAAAYWRPPGFGIETTQP